MKKRSYCLKNTHFLGVKISFQIFTNISKSSGWMENVYSINEENILSFEKYAFFWGVKISFQIFTNISESSGWILLPPLTFWKPFILPSCSSV